MSMEEKIDICATCRFGLQNYVSIIGTIPWCCGKHWHCKPGSLASDYMPKASARDKEGSGEYPYHNKIKQRIRNGELIDWFYTDTYPRIGTALVLVFSTEPHRRPIRPHRWPEYLPLLKAAGGEEHGSIGT